MTARENRRFGPTKNELKFRVAISGAGLAALIAAVLLRGLPGSIAMIEVIVIGGAFFGGTLAVSLRRLLKGDYPDR